MLKNLYLANMRWWLQQNMFNADGTLPIGYCYPNMNMAEGYNAQASAYWALTSFLTLALPESDGFWQAAEVMPPVTFASHAQAQTRQIITHSLRNQDTQIDTAVYPLPNTRGWKSSNHLTHCW